MHLLLKIIIFAINQTFMNGSQKFFTILSDKAIIYSLSAFWTLVTLAILGLPNIFEFLFFKPKDYFGDYALWFFDLNVVDESKNVTNPFTFRLKSISIWLLLLAEIIIALLMSDFKKIHQIGLFTWLFIVTSCFAVTYAVGMHEGFLNKVYIIFGGVIAGMFFIKSIILEVASLNKRTKY